MINVRMSISDQRSEFFGPSVIRSAVRHTCNSPGRKNGNYFSFRKPFQSWKDKIVTSTQRGVVGELYFVVMSIQFRIVDGLILGNNRMQYAVYVSSVLIKTWGYTEQ